jgi:uncharacterized protein YqgC (DUF456 family)
MDPFGEVLVGLVILIGLVGIVLPVLPGLFLEVGAVLLWAFVEGGSRAWSVAVAALAIGAAGTVVKYLVPGKRLREAGIPRSTLILAGILAIVGFFVIPVIGAPIGFVAGTYLAERNRLGATAAWPSTSSSVKAVGLAIGIELAAGLAIAGLWLIALLWIS